MHVRTQIRNALIKTITGLPTTGDNVFTDFYAITEKRLPALALLTGADSYDRSTLGKPAILDVSTEFKIFGGCKVNDTYQDVADQIILEIQKAINEDVTLKQLVRSVNITNVDVTLDYEQDRPISFIEVSISVYYRIIENDPETII